MRYLITGGCGFLGSQLARHAVTSGHTVTVYDDLSRVGSERNLEWLHEMGAVAFVRGDTRDRARVEETVRSARPDVVFHLAGQVAMTRSVEDPSHDFEVNVVGGHNVLEAVRRHAPEAVFLFSSTNKVYGDLERVRYVEEPTRYTAPDFPLGFSESLPLDFRGPYGCSKGAIDQYTLDYARAYGMRTVVLRHSSIYGVRQFATVDQGWIGWFVKEALERRSRPEKPVVISGTGLQVRDALFGSDLVSCYEAVVRSVDFVAGEAFNIGGGMENSLSLLELLAFLEEELAVKLTIERGPQRFGDQKVFVADISKARERLGWAPAVSNAEGLRRMVAWIAADA